MPYIGNDLATQFQAFATQTITGDGSTGYTLDRAVANGKELLVYINNVKQEEGSGKSYTASGTTITFSEAVASTDSCYLVYMGSAQQTVTAPAGSIVSSQFSSADLVLPKTVTIGSAAEEDTKLVFDGNAQDFHIGLDDSADDLVIGKGSALGTTTHMSFDENGHITKPLQPAFNVQLNSAQAISADSLTTIAWNTERLDANADFNTSTYKFIAPVTGKYFLSMHLRINNIDANSDYIDARIRTSNVTYQTVYDTDNASNGADVTFITLNLAVLADMDANDEAYCTIFVEGNVSAFSSTTRIDTESSAGFFGYLAC